MNKEKILLFSLIVITIIVVIGFINIINNEGAKCLNNPFNYMTKELDLDLNCLCVNNINGDVYSINRSELKHIRDPSIFMK